MRTAALFGTLMLCASALAACSVVLPLLGYPPEATRESPPQGIEQAALPVGAAAPNIERQSTEGPWHLTPGETQLLVFYRGHW